MGNQLFKKQLFINFINKLLFFCSKDTVTNVIGLKAFKSALIYTAV